MKKITLPVKVFLISEILIFLMIAGVVLTEIIFPLPANIEYRLIEENQKWSPRFWDNVVTVFLEFGFPLTFLLSAFGIILSIKKNLPKKSSVKEIIMFCIMICNFIVFGLVNFIFLVYLSGPRP